MKIDIKKPLILTTLISITIAVSIFWIIFLSGCTVAAGIEPLPYEKFLVEKGPTKNFNTKIYELNRPEEAVVGQAMLRRREFKFYSGNDALRPNKNCSIVLAPVLTGEGNGVRVLRTIDRLRVLGFTKYKGKKCYIMDVGLNYPHGLYRGLMVDAQTFHAVDRFIMGPSALGWHTSTWSIWLGAEILKRQADVSPKDTKFIPSTRVIRTAKRLMANFDLVYGGMSEGAIMLLYREYSDYRFTWVTDKPVEKDSPFIMQRRLIVQPDNALYKKQFFSISANLIKSL
jgi:hypothetical protein